MEVEIFMDIYYLQISDVVLIYSRSAAIAVIANRTACSILTLY